MREEALVGIRDERRLLRAMKDGQKMPIDMARVGYERSFGRRKGQRARPRSSSINRK